MVEIKPLCRGCYSQFGYSQVLYPTADGFYVCPRDAKHKYKRESNGEFTTILPDKF